MTVEKYIEEAIEKLRRKLPQLREIVYEFKANSEMHFLKIVPQTIFDEEVFAELDDEITTQFYNMGFPGSLCFISDESIVTLASPQIVRHFGSNVFYDFTYNMEFTEIASIQVENKSSIDNQLFGLKYNNEDSIFFSRKQKPVENISYYDRSTSLLINSVNETKYSGRAVDRRIEYSIDSATVVSNIQMKSNQDVKLQNLIDNNCNYALAA